MQHRRSRKAREQRIGGAVRQAQPHQPSLLEADESGPAAIISRRAADRIRAGHLWVYRSDVESLIPSLGRVEVQPGELLTLMDNRRIPLGTALYSAASQLTLRKVSGHPRVSRGEYLQNVAERVRAALSLRQPMFHDGTDSARLIFSEADDLPGIVADRYRDLIVLQLLTQGTAHDDLRALLAHELAGEDITLVVERPDPRIRELECLPAPALEPLFKRDDFRNGQTVFTLNGLRFHYDANSGQKTGAFLDQRLNYAAAASYAHGEALDVCTYQGGFALHLGRACDQVIGVDQSRAALEVAEQNLVLNQAQMRAKVEWIEADAFELLRAWEAEGRRFDTIVLDPPAFAKTSRAVEGAMRGYKELNVRALRMLRAGGTLITCSCSYHVDREAFTSVVADAAADAGRRVRLLESRGAAPDHPEVLTLPETGYLKCLVLGVS